MREAFPPTEEGKDTVINTPAHPRGILGTQTSLATSARAPRSRSTVARMRQVTDRPFPGHIRRSAMSARPTVIVAGILLVVRWLWSRNKRKGS